MKQKLTILFALVTLTSFGQKISVDTLFIPKIENFSNNQNIVLKFPIIKTGNLQVDKAINKDLKNRFTDNEYQDLPTDSTLIKWSEAIMYLDFKVTYIKNDLISLNISAEGCGAYCSFFTNYFTYNYKTGAFLTIDQIVDTNGNFKFLLLAEKDKQYEQQKIELKEMMFNENAALDEVTYLWASREYERCDNEFALQSFALHTDYLEIIDDCYLPHAIRSLTPTIVLNYKYVDIKKYLKIEY